MLIYVRTLTGQLITLDIADMELIKSFEDVSKLNEFARTHFYKNYTTMTNNEGAFHDIICFLKTLCLCIKKEKPTFLLQYGRSGCMSGKLYPFGLDGLDYDIRNGSNLRERHINPLLKELGIKYTCEKEYISKSHPYGGHCFGKSRFTYTLNIE